MNLPTRFTRKRKPGRLIVLVVLALSLVAGLIFAAKHLTTKEGRVAIAGVFGNTADLVPSQYRTAVTAWLDENERGYKISKWYSPVSLKGATHAVYYDQYNSVFRAIKENGSDVPGVAIRVEYQTDEGFERWVKNDKVFCVREDGRLLNFRDAKGSHPWLYTEDFYAGK